MSPARRRVVVTGLGIVSPAGCDLDRFWDTLTAGRPVISRIRQFDASSYPSQIAGEIDRDDAMAAAGPEAGRVAWDWTGENPAPLFGAMAVRQAIGHASLPSGVLGGSRTGLVAAGTAHWHPREYFPPAAAASHAGGMDLRRFARELASAVETDIVERESQGFLAERLARLFGVGGPVSAVMTACATGTQALGDAARWIRRDRADVVIVCGSDCAVTPLFLASFCLLGALSTRNDEPDRASRPFDAGRDGFVLAEGAGALVLESLEHATARQARILAELVGFGSACDAYRLTDPHPDGDGAVLAMSRALADAGLGPEAVDYVNAHGTSTPANDRIETLAIRRVFGAHADRLAVSSTKSVTGHAAVAAGAVEAVATVLALSTQMVPPTINYDTPDPDCTLDYVPNAARRAPLGTAISNTFAFGGQSATVAFSRWDG